MKHKYLVIRTLTSQTFVEAETDAAALIIAEEDEGALEWDEEAMELQATRVQP